MQYQSYCFRWPLLGISSASPFPFQVISHRSSKQRRAWLPSHQGSAKSWWASKTSWGSRKQQKPPGTACKCAMLFRVGVGLTGDCKWYLIIISILERVQSDHQSMAGWCPINMALYSSQVNRNYMLPANREPLTFVSPCSTYQSNCCRTHQHSDILTLVRFSMSASYGQRATKLCSRAVIVRPESSRNDTPSFRNDDRFAGTISTKQLWLYDSMTSGIPISCYCKGVRPCVIVYTFQVLSCSEKE